MADGPGHHGDPTGEYLAVRAGAALVDPSWSAVRVVGPDAVAFLEGLLTQRLEPGRSVRSFLLGPRGKLRAIIRAVVGDDDVVLVTDAGRRDTLATDLRHYRIRVKAEVRDDERPVRLLLGSAADDALGGAVVPAGGWVAVGEGVVADATVGPFRGYLLVGVDPVGEVTPVGSLAWTARRIEAGEPVMDVDVDEGTIPQETGLVPSSVDFSKGCYLGQELVARIDTRGHVNQRLVGLRLGTNLLPPVGCEVMTATRPVGTVTSVGESLDLRAPVALGMVRREAADGDLVDLTWEGGSAAATVVALPMVD